MSYGSNSTIAYPGPNWDFLLPEAFEDWQLDIVGFLAILGEASILANAQVSALSRLFYLPRLLPAPQALLRVSRPLTLPPEAAHVTAVVSGNKKTHVHHVASILLGCDPDKLKKHWVRVVSVKKSEEVKPPTKVDHFLRGTARQDTVWHNGQRQERRPVTVKAKAFGPVTYVTLLGFFLSLVIFVVSLVFGDGMSTFAIITLSLLSTICGAANKWTLSLPARPADATALKEDTVVIRYPEGSFLIVKCNDEVARELFFAPEEINYTIKSPQLYRLLALVGSVLLMAGVILLANARLELQFAYAGAYLIMNAAHWAVAALPAKMHWDLSAYEVKEEGIEGGPESTSFTQALWKTILITKRTRWVALNEAAPKTEDWNQWLKKARKAAMFAPKPVIGDLINPIYEWSKASGGRGIIHRAPPLDEWEPKRAYNALSHNKVDEEELSATEDGELYTKEAEATVGAAENGHDNGNANGHPH